MTIPAGHRTAHSSHVAGWVVLWVAWLGLVSAPALAHGEDGYFDELSVSISSTRELSVDTLLRYEDDDDPAPGATVTLVAQHVDGEVVGPLRMDPGADPGRYVGAATLPSSGEWEVRLTSLEPDAVLRSTATVPADETSTTAPAEPEPTSSSPSQPTTADDTAPSAAPSSPAPPTGAGPTQETDVVGSPDLTADSSAVSPAVVGGAVVVLVLAAVGLVLARRRQ